MQLEVIDPVGLALSCHFRQVKRVATFSNGCAFGVTQLISLIMSRDLIASKHDTIRGLCHLTNIWAA
jgi:hypothetical protein